jgi:hypothetical protein
MKKLIVAVVVALILGIGIGIGHAAMRFVPIWTCQYLESLPIEQPWTIIAGPGQVGGVIAFALRDVPESLRPYPTARQQLCFVQGDYAGQ